MNILVLGNTYSTARMHLLNMVDDMKYGNVKKIHDSPSETYAELTNGDTYQALCASENARGCKCDKVYVNAEVDPEILNRIIKPMLCMSSLPTNEQIIYY